MAMPVCVMFRLIAFQDLVIMKTSRSVNGTVMVLLRSTLLLLVEDSPKAPVVCSDCAGKTGFDVKQPRT